MSFRTNAVQASGACGKRVHGPRLRLRIRRCPELCSESADRAQDSSAAEHLTSAFHSEAVTTFEGDQAERLDVACRRIREFSFQAAAFDYYLPLKRLDTYVKEHLDQPLTSTEAAAIANYERSYFSDFFKEKTRVAFKDWNSHRRIRRAVQMLSVCDDSLTAIAEKCGFPSIRVFETHCLRWTGIQPKALQRLIRQQI